MNSIDKSIEAKIWPQCCVPNSRECTLKIKHRSRLPINTAELKLERELLFVSCARSTLNIKLKNQKATREI